MPETRDETVKVTPVLTVVPTRITAEQVIAALLIVFALSYGKSVLALLMLALLGSLALAPPVRALSRLIPRWLASAVVVLALASGMVVTGYAISDEVAAFSRSRCSSKSWSS